MTNGEMINGKRGGNEKMTNRYAVQVEGWGLIILFVIFCICFTSACISRTELSESTTDIPIYSASTDIPIYSVNIGQGIDGEFFLGCGSINSKMYYYFYVSKDGGKILMKVDAERTIIYESNGTPYFREDRGMNTNEGILVLPINTTKLEYKIDIDKV